MRHQCALSYINYPRFSIASLLSVCAWGSDSLSGLLQSDRPKYLSFPSFPYVSSFKVNRDNMEFWQFRGGGGRSCLSESEILVETLWWWPRLIKCRQRKRKDTFVVWPNTHLTKMKITSRNCMSDTFWGMCRHRHFNFVIQKGKFSRRWSSTSKMLLDFELFSWS